MSQSVVALVILLLLVPLWIKLARNFVSGLSYAVVILVACTHFLRIETPGIFPELTIHRLVFISLFVAWWFLPSRRPIRSVPLYRWIITWAVFALVSLLGASDPLPGIKRYIEAVFELFAFYFIISTTLENEEHVYRVLKAAFIGVAIVACIAIVEKYANFNVVDRYVVADPELKSRTIRSTYRHRILLGTGMAMGFPLAIALLQFRNFNFRPTIVWLSVAAMLAACYFSRSRGPWLAAVLAAGLLALFGSAKLRKPLIALGLVSLMVLLARPGIWNTVFGLASATVDSDSFKGGTFKYRLELWNVALAQIKDSPFQLLFGTGPASGLNLSIDWTLSYRGKEFQIQSWDNDFAYSLLQYGLLGLLPTIVVYGSVAWRLLSAARAQLGPERNFYLCLCASTLVLFFMMTNVHVFARQLHYLFWTITAVGFAAMRIHSLSVHSDAPAGAPGEEPEPLWLVPPPASNSAQS